MIFLNCFDRLQLPVAQFIVIGSFKSEATCGFASGLRS